MTLCALCPDCPPVHEARALFFGGDFVSNLVSALSPFLAALAVVVLIVRWIGGRARRDVEHAS
jgi:hypothetical protein